MRDHDVEDYAELANMDGTDVAVLTEDDRDCLNELGDYLVGRDAWRRFAVWLLHKHFEPNPGEVFIERAITSPLQTHTAPFSRPRTPRPDRAPPRCVSTLINQSRNAMASRLFLLA